LDHISESLKTIFWVKIFKLFDADADPGILLSLDRGSGMAKIGSLINISDPQHCFEDGSGFCGVFILFIQLLFK
jgi:hypothetical protein